MGASHFLWLCGCGATSHPPFEEVGPAHVFEASANLAEGWQMPRNPGSTNNRRRRSIKCCVNYSAKRRPSKAAGSEMRAAHIQKGPESGICGRARMHETALTRQRIPLDRLRHPDHLRCDAVSISCRMQPCPVTASAATITVATATGWPWKHSDFKQLGIEKKTPAPGKAREPRFARQEPGQLPPVRITWPRVPSSRTCAAPKLPTSALSTLPETSEFKNHAPPISKPLRGP